MNCSVSPGHVVRRFFFLIANITVDVHGQMLGTMSELGNNLYKQTEIEQVRLMKEAQYERDGGE